MNSMRLAKPTGNPPADTSLVAKLQSQLVGLEQRRQKDKKEYRRRLDLLQQRRLKDKQDSEQRSLKDKQEYQSRLDQLRQLVEKMTKGRNDN